LLAPILRITESLCPNRAGSYPARQEFCGKWSSGLLLHRSEGLGGNIQQFFLGFNQAIDAALE
jgi:hypothetical protein